MRCRNSLNVNPPEFLEVDAVLFVHGQALREFGGLHGVKSDALLKSALERPVNKQRYAQPDTLDLFDLASCYAYGLASNHPFNDANKRTGWASCVLFLKTNGIDVAVEPADVVDRMLLLVQGRLDEAGFAAWLRASRRT